MKTSHAAIALVLLLALRPGVAQSESPIVVGQSYVMHSNALDMDRGYRVALPEGFAWSPDTHYPVLYVLDAQDHFAHVATTVAFLTSSGEIPPTLVVGIDSGNRIHEYTQTDWSEAWVGGGGAGKFQTFLNDELIPLVEERWRADGFRTLMGHSASAQFALHQLATAPSVFRAWFVLSPSLDWDHGLPQRELAEAFAQATSLPGFVYFAYSNDFRGALADDLRLGDTLMAEAPPGLRCQVRAMPQETHGGMALPAVIDALRSLYPNYRYDPGDLDVGVDAVQAHYDALSKILNWSMPIPERTINELGYAALHNGDVELAIDLFRRNVREHPLSANAHDSLADGLAGDRRWEEAAQAGDRAAELASKYGNPLQSVFEENAVKRHAEAKAHESDG
ncbi:MAG: alpha/beta hydrolase-fold protein [Candidatus Eisenbacteria bacterium]